MHRLSHAAGTYAVVRGNRDGVWIYTDAAAMMGVYHRDGRASSSPSLLPGLERDPVIDAQYSLGARNEWFTGSICPFKGVRFLPANHHLDLRSGHIERFWPEALPRRDDCSNGIARCAGLLRETVEGASRRGRMIVSLTGGKDSRVNLAASRRILERVHFFTVRDEKTPPGDRKVPADFCRRFPDMKHAFIDRRPDEPPLTRLYDEISAGLAVGARRGMLAACLDASHWGEIHLSGALGEVARGYFWHTRSPTDVRLDTVLAKFGNPAHCIRQGLEEWRASVPAGLSAAMIYNLLYLEQRGGRWAGVGENASALFYHPFSAFNSRPFFEALATVPEHLQYSDRLSVALIGEMWPELLDLPFCHSGHRLSPLVPNWVKHAIKRFLS